MESGIVIVSTVVDDKEAADRIARELVERRLAACVQVSAEPVTSKPSSGSSSGGEVVHSPQRVILATLP